MEKYDYGYIGENDARIVDALNWWNHLTPEEQEEYRRNIDKKMEELAIMRDKEIEQYLKEHGQ